MLQVNTAHRLFRSAVYSPGIYLDALNGTDTGLADVYPSFDLGDDLFWAASWLFRASSNGIRAYNLTYYTEAVKVTMELAYSVLDAPGVDVDYVNNLALVHVATQTQDAQYHLPAQSFIWDWICDSEQVKYTRNGRAYYFDSPYLGNTAAAAAMAALYIKTNAGWDFVANNKALVKGALPAHACTAPGVVTLSGTCFQRSSHVVQLEPRSAPFTLSHERCDQCSRSLQ
jgi:Glycosyl hydrolase family 9